MMKQSNYKRNHISFIVEEIIKSIKSIFIFIIIAITNIDEGGIYVILGLIVLSILKSLIKWFTVKFTINNNEIIYYAGLINKKKLEIPLDKINTIDINRNIIDRLFKVSSLKIDTGAVKEIGQEIKLKINEKDAYELRDIINGLENKIINDNSKSPEDINKNSLYKTITFKEILIYALSKSKIFWAIGGVFFIIDFIFNLEETFNLSITNNVVDNIDIEKAFSIGLLRFVLIGILIFIVIYIFISIIYIIFEFVRLYNFTLINDQNDIKIKYGLLTIKEYSIPKDKIYAIRYKQNILQQLFKISQVEVVTIGYGDEKNEQAILYPMADRTFINSILKLLLPSFEFNGDINKPSKGVLSRFIIKRSVILILFLIVPLYFIIPNTILTIKIFIFSILFLYNALLGYLNYKNTSLGVNKELIIASSGSIEKVTSVIKQEYLQSVEIKENPFQRKKYVCNYRLDIYSNKFGDMVIIQNMNRDLLNNIDENLIL